MRQRLVLGWLILGKENKKMRYILERNGLPFLRQEQCGAWIRIFTTVTEEGKKFQKERVEQNE